MKPTGMETVRRVVTEGVGRVVEAFGEGPTTTGNTGLMTRATGCPIGNMKNSLTAGPRGPTLLEDIAFLEKIQHFDREKIPPRNVHALGNGAYGTLTITNDITKYSRAAVFSSVGKTTDIFVRFSGVFTELGEADTTRDLRGYAIKFYTEEGAYVDDSESAFFETQRNWDLLGINTPVFNVRDAKLGPDAIHAFKRDPRSFEWNEETVWDFVCNHPEALHQTLMIFTDRVGTPKSYRFMHGYGCNTFSLINSKNEKFWVKFHMLTHYEATGLTDVEAKLIAGEDPDWLKRDLREAIERGDYPKWRFAMQVMPEEEGYRYPWTFDCTKVWPHAQFPLIDIGTITLNRNPTNYHAEVEQVAFSPANVVPGIGFSPDKLLQGRIFLYSDTQFHRLGDNYLQIPVNQPKGAKQVHTNYVGGQHNMDEKNPFPHYYPSFNGGPSPDARYEHPPLATGNQAYYYDYAYEGEDADYYEQPRALFQGELTKEEQDNLIYNLATSFASIKSQSLIDASINHLAKVDPTLGQRVRDLQSQFKMRSDKAEKSTAQIVWKKLYDENCKNIAVP